MTGSVKLRVLRPIRVTHIVVSLHGYVQVFKNPGSPGDGLRANAGSIGTGRGKQSGEYYGNGFASLFKDEVVLCGDGRLAEGSYQFNFELEFPDTDLPSSIDVSVSFSDLCTRANLDPLVRARDYILHDYWNHDPSDNNIAYHNMRTQNLLRREDRHIATLPSKAKDYYIGANLSENTSEASSQEAC